MPNDVNSLLKRINQTGITYQVFSRPEILGAPVESPLVEAAVFEAPAASEAQDPDPVIEAMAAASEPPERSRPALVYARPAPEQEEAPRTLFRRYAKDGSASEGASGERLSELFRRYAD
ncbi:MAG: hypothetical protein Q7S93_08370 [Phenylobacterium sp.]|uniref:hypothetical protein n=1 Tax=Phenylobacterium sp. TaxID=1871053 RepID=UPI00272090C8|nr:hypothetical protein [Phenylobacterium sp.]MDO8410061.1 hypothetical protein [Phenylobacterium sp.]